MWYYEKKLQKPISIKHTNPALAKLIITQYGGPDGSCLSAVSPISKTRISAFFRPRRPL